MNTKISVVVPVYNTKEYLRDSINSIIDQKDYIHEIIIVNDGSTDGSGEYLDKLYSNLDYIKIFHTKNQRQGPARNLGTQKSNGDYIYYFDSDDILKPGLFKKFYDLIHQHPELEIFSFSGESFIDKSYQDNINKKDTIPTQSYSRKINVICKDGEAAFNKLFPNDSFFPLPFLYIFKKSIVEKSNIKFRSIRFEDEEFVFQLFLNAGKTIISDESFCKRRIWYGSTMELDRCFADIQGYFETIKTLNKLIKSHQLNDYTIQNLNKKIKILIEAVIKMKVRSSLNLTQEELKIYKDGLRKYIYTDARLFYLYYFYSFEYNLRLLKKKYWTKIYK